MSERGDDEFCPCGWPVPHECQEDEPPCWAAGPGATRCGLDTDHEGDHRFNLWEAP